MGGSFLNGRFDRGEVLYMKVPQGFEKFYPRNVLLLQEPFMKPSKWLFSTGKRYNVHSGFLDMNVMELILVSTFARSRAN